MKKTQKINILSRELKNFFSDYLPRLRGISPNTIHSYRDCLLLLLKYISTQKKRPVTKIDIEDFDAKQIIEFLQMLEDKRHNSIIQPDIIKRTYLLTKRFYVPFNIFWIFLYSFENFCQCVHNFIFILKISIMRSNFTSMFP
jgi:site-specific recombinase XerD